MVKKKEIFLLVILFAIVLATFPLSIVEISDNQNIEDHQIKEPKTSEWNPGFNYTIKDNYPYKWIEINVSGTEIPTFYDGAGSTDNDDGYYGINLTAEGGWEFPFYGKKYPNLNVSTNGWMTFTWENDPATYIYCFDQKSYDFDPIPQNASDALDHNNHNYTVMLLAIDLDLRGHGQMFYQFFGTAPNRYFVIEYFKCEEMDTSDNQTMEAIFYENGDIKFQYKNITDPMAGWSVKDAKVGLDNGDLVNYSPYTNDWNGKFGGAVKERAVYFRLNSLPPTPLPSPDDDDDDDDDTGIVVVIVVIIIIACVGGVVVVVIVLIKKGIIGTARLKSG